MQRLFSVDSRLHGKSSLLSAWQPQSHLVASCGSTRTVFVNDRRGKLIDQIALPLSTACTHLEWNRSGEVLACLQEHASSILLWHCATKQVETIDLQLKEPSFMRWARHADKIAIGGTKGDMVIYDRITKEKTVAAAHLKKRVSCGEWSADGKLAFSSDDRQITIALDTGSTFGQVKVKSKPIKLAFGSNLKTTGRDNIVSVSMDRKSILFYNLDDPENALELAFQQRYGQIVNFHWFRDGFIMVAFTLGFVVVISTKMSEIGREQFCAQYHRDSLREIAYSQTRNKIATCNLNCVKIVDMSAWKEVHTEYIDKEAGAIEHLDWSPDGSILSVATRNGFLYNFAVLSSDSDTLGSFKDSLSLAGLNQVKLSPNQMSPNVCCMYLLGFLLLVLLLLLNHINAPFTSLIELMIDSKY